MSNMNIAQERPLNARPAQPVDNKPLINDKTTMAEAYKLVWEIKLNKLKAGDKQYILTNLGKNDDRVVNNFVKEVAAEAEAAFDKATKQTQKNP
jgi:hypothetical protein